MPEARKEENKKEDNEKLYPLRTFKTDVSEFMKKEDTSFAEIVAKQQEKRPFYELGQRQGKNKKILFIAGLFLCFLAVIGTVLLFKEPAETQPGPTTPTAPQPLLPSQLEKTLQIKDSQDLKRQMDEILSSSFSAGDLVYLLLKKDDHYLNSKDFLSILRTGAGTGLAQFIEDDFFLGIINLEKKHPLVIFEAKEEKYEYIFSGMLQWEKRMTGDLSFILGEGVYLEQSPSFQDKIIKNQDARFVQGNEEIVFLYIILNKKYIIITDSQKALEEIINRFVILKFS